MKFILSICLIVLFAPITEVLIKRNDSIVSVKIFFLAVLLNVFYYSFRIFFKKKSLATNLIGVFVFLLLIFASVNIAIAKEDSDRYLITHKMPWILPRSN